MRPTISDQIVAWKVPSLNSGVASTRYRCLLPAHRLQQKGIRSRIYSGTDQVDFGEDIACLIFVKSFSSRDLELAREAKSRSVSVVLDLCDNIFYRSKHPQPSDDYRAIVLIDQNFRAMAALADLIVTTGSELAAVIQEEVRSVQLNIKVIPDAEEKLSDSREALEICRKAKLAKVFGHGLFWFLSRGVPLLGGASVRGFILIQSKLFARVSILFGFLYRLLMTLIALIIAPINSRARFFLAETRKGKESKSSASPQSAEPETHPASREDLQTLLWFGNSGIRGLFGITDLELIESSLRTLAQEKRFELVVVTDSYPAFLKHVASMQFPTRFVQWSPEAVEREMKRASVALIPNALNPFSKCKSANRTVLALSRGVPVVATRTSALDAFESCVIFDSWIEGVISYLDDPALVQEHLAKARMIINREFSLDSVATRWVQEIEKLMGANLVSRSHEGQSAPI